jgi:hypothetical protein
VHFVIGSSCSCFFLPKEILLSIINYHDVNDQRCDFT